MMKTIFLVAVVVALSISRGRADLLDKLGLRRNTSTNSTGLSQLSQDQMVQGLKEALGQGSRSRSPAWDMMEDF
jgi:hypothetical protein